MTKTRMIDYLLQTTYCDGETSLWTYKAHFGQSSLQNEP